MTKLMENIYRCVNIALVNELKHLCLRMKVQTKDEVLAELMAEHIALKKVLGNSDRYLGVA